MFRRNFLRRTLISIPAIPLVFNNLKGRKSDFDTGIVVSTWNNIEANKAAWNVVSEGGYALDAVEAGARVPEANPKDSSVGFGGRPDSDGNVTLDACIMDEKGNAGSVCYLQNIMHPISVARKVMEETPHVILAGKGAQKFALEQGFKKQNILSKASKKAWKKWRKTKDFKAVINIENHDTIGMISMDKAKRVSGACTTSGLAFKRPGRVGDSPIIGAGLFVDNEVGAAAATGMGELVLRTLGSFLVVEFMRQGLNPLEACRKAVMRIVHKEKKYKDFQIGFVAINRNGEHGAYSIQPGFMYVLSKDDTPKIINADSFIK